MNTETCCVPGVALAGLIRALVLKRLESSIEAFRSTVNVLIGSNRNFREALEAGYVPIGDTASRMLAGSEFDADDLLEMAASARAASASAWATASNACPFRRRLRD